MDDKKNINLLYEKVDYSEYKDKSSIAQTIMTIGGGIIVGVVGALLTLFLTIVFEIILFGLIGNGGLLLNILAFLGMSVGVNIAGNYFFKKITDAKDLRITFMIVMMVSYVLVPIGFVFL